MNISSGARMKQLWDKLVSNKSAPTSVVLDPRSAVINGTVCEMKDGKRWERDQFSLKHPQQLPLPLFYDLELKADYLSAHVSSLADIGSLLVNTATNGSPTSMAIAKAEAVFVGEFSPQSDAELEIQIHLEHRTNGNAKVSAGVVIALADNRGVTFAEFDRASLGSDHCETHRQRLSLPIGSGGCLSAHLSVRSQSTDAISTSRTSVDFQLVEFATSDSKRGFEQ